MNHSIKIKGGGLGLESLEGICAITQREVCNLRRMATPPLCSRSLSFPSPKESHLRGLRQREAAREFPPAYAPPPRGGGACRRSVRAHCYPALPQRRFSAPTAANLANAIPSNAEEFAFRAADSESAGLVLPSPGVFWRSSSFQPKMLDWLRC